MERIENIELNKRANRAIAHGALTNSKRPSTFVKGVYPTHIQVAHTSVLIDVDGNKYLDFICGLGTNLFGYTNSKIRQAINHAWISGGCSMSLSSYDEVTFAEKLKGTFPFLDKVRFLKSGSEGCSAAIKIARAHTERLIVLSEGYHGWHDDFVQLTDPANGVIPDYKTLKLPSDLTRLDDDILKNTAAIIVEPVILDASEKRQKWLQTLRDICTKYGIQLIFDETITAYRFPSFCVAKHWSILPDIWVGGKAIAGGLPLSVVGGRSEVMESDYFVSSTWAGDRLAIYAASEAINLVHGEFNPDDLWIEGQEFLDRFNDIDPEIVNIKGYPTRGVFEYKSEIHKHMFMQEMCLAGILIGPTWFYNSFLHKEIDNVIDIAKKIIQRIKQGKVSLKGESPLSPFAEKVRKEWH